MDLDSHRHVTAARLKPVGNVLTIIYADGGSQSASTIDPEDAKEIVAELGLIPGGTSGDGVRYWWR